MATWNFIFKQILECMTLCLQDHDLADLVELLPHYSLFLLTLGLRQRRRVDDVWDALVCPLALMDSHTLV